MHCKYSKVTDYLVDFYVFVYVNHIAVAQVLYFCRLSKVQKLSTIWQDDWARDFTLCNFLAT